MTAALRLVAAAAASVGILLYLAVAVLRLRYPFELEWMEGATVEHVRRVIAGAPLYVAPSIDFVPFAYPPLYYYASALVALATGAGFLPVRAVSIAASAGSFWLIFLVVRRDAGAWAGTIAAGLFAATYAVTGAWLDIGRVDSLYAFLILGVYALLARARTPAAFVAAALVAVLAFLTKQTATVTLVPIALYLLVRSPSTLLTFVAPATVLAAAAVLVADRASASWFTYYVFQLPRLRFSVSSDSSRLWEFWWRDVIVPFAPAVAVFALHAARSFRASWRSDVLLRHLILAGGLIGSSWLARLEGGAWTNALIPACAAIAILFGLAIAGLPRPACLAPALALLQFATLAYDPRPLVPTTRDVEGGRAAVAAIAALPRDVFVVDHGYLAVMAGKRSLAHGWAMVDVLWADYNGYGAPLEADVRARIAAREFGAIVVDDTRNWFSRDIEAHYVPAARLVPAPDAFWPRSGARRRPEVVYLPDTKR